jgi:Txe/YoeB family toxin of Txe-Axe toxin-antitoxin module
MKNRERKTVEDTVDIICRDKFKIEDKIENAKSHMLE